MDKAVIIKSSKHGLVINLDPEMSFSDLSSKIREKFTESSKFFGNVKMALTIEGRNLSNDEIDEVINIIDETTEIEVLAVLDSSEMNDKLFKDELNKVFNELDAYAAEIYPLNVEEGISLEFKRSVVILGNVSKNAEIHTDGSVFVLGKLEGKVYAGELGNVSAKIFADTLSSEDICIADVPYKAVKEENTKKNKGFFRKKEIIPEKNGAVLLSLVDGEICLEHIIPVKG